MLDYKSDRVGPDADLEALVERDYGVQRLLYALAVLREGAAGGGGRALVPGAPEEWVVARYTAAERATLEERARRAARARARAAASRSASSRTAACA